TSDCQSAHGVAFWHIESSPGLNGTSRGVGTAVWDGFGPGARFVRASRCNGEMDHTATPEAADGRSPFRVELVCLGNICRSPMADVVLRARLERLGLDDRVRVTSSGIGPWHVGEPMRPQASE